MNSIHDIHDIDDLDERLTRAGTYLMRQSAVYREVPAHRSTDTGSVGSRHRRVLVGSVAAAALFVVALAGSFIGDTSSGNVEVAEAAWSAVPAELAVGQAEKVALDCGIRPDDLAAIENVPPASIPRYMLEPTVVDVRGSTTTAVYFTWRYAMLCVQFGDGSINIFRSPMEFRGENDWQVPAAIEVSIQGAPATMVIGYLPPEPPQGDPNVSGDAADTSDEVFESTWTAFLDVPGFERTSVSVNATMGRYLAWVPTVGTYTVTFVNSVTGEERVVGNVTSQDSGVNLTPVTTITIPD